MVLSSTWLWWAVAAERYNWLVALGTLYLGLKESAALSLVGLGLFLALSGLLFPLGHGLEHGFRFPRPSGEPLA